MPYGLTSIRVGSKIVPVRNFGRASHLVVGLIPDLHYPLEVSYIPLDSRSDVKNYPEEFIDEIIFCSESDWLRLKSTIAKYNEDKTLQW